MKVVDEQDGGEVHKVGDEVNKEATKVVLEYHEEMINEKSTRTSLPATSASSGPWAQM